MEALYIILSVTLGWLFGILGPIIINHISGKYKKITLQRIIVSELKDLKERLTMIPYRIRCDYGIVDKELIIWIKTQIESFEDCKQNKTFINLYEKMVNENNGDLTNFLRLCNTASLRESASFHFKKMSTSTIDANLINFGMLDNEFLKKLLEVKFQINVFNEEVQSVNDYLKMTFDSNITGANHQIITEEIKNKNLLIAKKAILIVEKINLILDSENKI